jgi:hypothetical protein
MKNLIKKLNQEFNEGSPTALIITTALLIFGFLTFVLLYTPKN